MYQQIIMFKINAYMFNIYLEKKYVKTSLFFLKLEGEKIEKVRQPHLRPIHQPFHES